MREIAMKKEIDVKSNRLIDDNHFSHFLALGRNWIHSFVSLLFHGYRFRSNNSGHLGDYLITERMCTESSKKMAKRKRHAFTFGRLVVFQTESFNDEQFNWIIKNEIITNEFVKTKASADSLQFN